MAATPPAAPVAVVRFPAQAGEPIALQFIDATLEVLLCRFDDVRGQRISSAIWGVPGAYVLIGLSTRVGAEASGAVARARPGVAGDLLERTRRHAADPAMAWAHRVLLVRDTRRGFNIAQASYLEGRLHDACRAAAGVEHDWRRDGDDTLQAHERAELDRLYLPHVHAVLELAGIPLDAYPEPEAQPQ